MEAAHGHGHDHAHEHAPSGLMRYVTTTNHKDIGSLYLWFSFVMFLVGGFMEVLRSWMEEPAEEPSTRDTARLRDRVAAAFDTVNALLTVPDSTGRR